MGFLSPLAQVKANGGKVLLTTDFPPAGEVGFNGLRIVNEEFDAAHNGSAVADDVGAITHFYNGAPFTIESRLAITIGVGAPASFAPGGLPLDANGKVAVSSGGVAAYGHDGMLFDAAGRLVAEVIAGGGTIQEFLIGPQPGEESLADLSGTAGWGPGVGGTVNSIGTDSGGVVRTNSATRSNRFYPVETAEAQPPMPPKWALTCAWAGSVTQNVVYACAFGLDASNLVGVRLSGSTTQLQLSNLVAGAIGAFVNVTVASGVGKRWGIYAEGDQMWVAFEGVQVAGPVTIDPVIFGNPASRLGMSARSTQLLNSPIGKDFKFFILP
jgi:hypothetical protein